MGKYLSLYFESAIAYIYIYSIYIYGNLYRLPNIFKSYPLYFHHQYNHGAGVVYTLELSIALYLLMTVLVVTHVPASRPLVGEVIDR